MRVACYYGSRGFRCHRTFMSISWVQNLFLWVFRGSETFSRGSFVSRKFFSWVFVGPNFFLLGISWVQFFFLWLICDSTIFSCWLQKYKNTPQTTHSFLNRFQQLSIVYIRKVLHLRNYLRYTRLSFFSKCIFRHLFSSVLGSFHL